MDTAAAAVFGDLDGGAVKPNVQAKEEGREGAERNMAREEQ